MCVDPVTAITIGTTLLSAGVGAAGQIQQGQAQAQASKYNAKVAEMNATLADRKSRDALERGKIEEQNKRQEISQLQGRQKAAMAANGVDLTFGSPLDTMVDTATLGELDALTVRRNANREAYDYEVQGVNQRSGAALDRMNAKSATTGSYLAAAGTVLGGVSKAAGQYGSSTIGRIS